MSSSVKAVVPLNIQKLTFSALWLALQQLGFHPYHSRDLFANKDHDLPLWTRLMDSKSMREPPNIERWQFDEIFAGFDVSRRYG